MANELDYSSMTRAELIDRLNHGDKAAADYFAHLLDEDRHKAIEHLRQYEATHDMTRHDEAYRPFLDMIATIDTTGDDYPERLREYFEMLQAFQDAHRETVEIITNLEQGRPGTQLYDFCAGLTQEDFAKILGAELSPEEWERFNADRVFYFIGLPMDACISLYEGKQKVYYRTKEKARQSASIVETMPRALAIPTLQDYRNALEFFQQGKAYLTKIAAIETMQFRDGKLYMPELDRPGMQPRLKALKEVELQNMTTKEGIEEINLPLLKLYYTIFLYEFQKTMNVRDVETVSVYVPDLAKVMGKKANLTQAQIEETIIADLERFHTITGIVFTNEGGKRRKSYFQVLNFESYNAPTNTITFSSPYMKEVIKAIYDAGKRRDKSGNVRLKKSGEPMMIATHSYLANPDLSNAKNHAAAQNVFIILALIEEAGHNTANIKASTIIERNVQLAERIKKQQSTSDANKLLKRTFKKTWELLRQQTRLIEKYNNIQLPDADNPASIPTMTTLDMVFKFPHDGINKT